ncbi:hypothetical protein [Flavobacterium gillisiae]|uniref:hypothetical protein n=1 Tax=Flavobacterium gillisiae TaxID=150146 RepID=UPI000B859B26|nr:hypothetical protein [Flavobacterium gillisiae]
MNKDITNTFFFIHQLKQGQNSAIEGCLLFDFNPNKTDLTVIRSKKKIRTSYPYDQYSSPMPLKDFNPNIKPQNTGY